MSTWTIKYKENILATYDRPDQKDANKILNIPKKAVDKIDIKTRTIYLKVLPQIIYKRLSFFSTDPMIIYISFDPSEAAKSFLGRHMISEEILWESDQMLVARLLFKLGDT